ncbi:DUF1310 family protein [Ligilactobacillus pabuli]|nr:DUF1310 family protein [Ligilactobacillus pabuli]
MKRKTKIVLLSVVITIALIVSLIGGGKYYMNQRAEHQHEEMVAYVKQYQRVIENDLRESDKNHFIKSITINYNTIKHNPMGGIDVTGYVNGDKKLVFHSGIDKYIIENKEKIETDGVGITSKLAELMGDE